MQLNLTNEQRNYIKITYASKRFEVDMGEKETIHREYYSLEDMMNEFEENGIEQADFDDTAHAVYNHLLEKAYQLGQVLS